jgi:transitional endoplasmic reticulum ATPase
MRSRRSKLDVDDREFVDPNVRLWMLKLLVPLKCYRPLFDGRSYDCEGIAMLFDVDIQSNEFDKAKARGILTAQLRDAEKDAPKLVLPEPLAGNIQKLSSLIGLSDVECKLLSFAVFLHNDRLLNETADLLGRELNSLKLFHILSVLLDVTEKEIRAAFNSNSMLSRTALLTVDRSYSHDLKSKLSVLSTAFSDRLMSDSCDSPIDWLRNMVNLSKPANLKFDNYDHLKDDLGVLLPYLRQSVDKSQQGVNVFLYGSPGTGKTELTRILSEKLGCPLYEISSEDEDGDPISGERRLSTIRAAQAFFKNSNTLLLFDEVEDVFGDGGGMFGAKSTAQTRKAWMNRLLEENSIPTFWLCNDISSIDPAFIRRFDWVLEIPIPPKKQREVIIREHCNGILDDKGVKTLSACTELAPAVITRAAKVVNALGDQFSQEKLSETFQGLIHKTLTAQGHQGLKKDSVDCLPDFYDPDLINCDADLKELAEGIKNHGSARICLFGIPGTGKSAYARWLAESLDKPLHVKRGSDLLSMWVGGTEKNIARIFREAEEDNAVLLIDEVDSFLQDRRMSQHSWEITGVNEMLTRMESYNGIFIASTNRVDGLDAASLRRFDLKIKFDALKTEQAWKLLQSYAHSFGLKTPEKKLQVELQKLTYLTPGDFALVARRHRFKPIVDVEGLIIALKSECALKTPYQTQPIGFVC